MRVIFSPAAIRDLEEIGDYIHADNPAAARRFIVALRQRCVQLGEAPFAGVARPEIGVALRSVTFQRYILFYVVSDAVRIERVLHGARDLRAALGEI